MNNFRVLKDYVLRQIKYYKRYILMVIVIPFISFILNIVMGEYQIYFGLSNIIISLTYIAILFITISIIINKSISSFIRGSVYNKYHELADIISGNNEHDELNESKYGIISDKELSIYEANCDCEEIWLLASDLSTEVDGGLYADIVPNNLKRGIKYKLFVKNSNTINMRLKQLEKKYGNIDGVEIFYLDDDFYVLVANIDFTIYNPYKNALSGRIGYMGLNIPENEDMYEFELSDDLVDAISSKLLEYIEKHSEVKR